MVPISPAILSNAIASIYDAAYGPATWDAALESLVRLFQGSKACFGRLGPNLQPDDVVVTNRDPAFQRRYIEEHAYSPNVLADALVTAPVGCVYSDHALVGEGRLERSRVWNEWMAPQDMYGGIGCKVMESGSSFWIIDIQRGRTQPNFETADAELLNIIVPHLARAAKISRRFQSTQLLTSTFSHLPYGIALVDASMRIKAMNAAAETILLHKGSALVGKAGHLAAADPDDKIALQRLVAQSCNTRGDVIVGVGGDLLLRRKHGSRNVDLALSVGPLLNPLHELSFVGRHAVIFIREMSLDLPARFAEQARALFALSPKEARLAASLASGRTLRQAAADNQIKFSTARSYLENIFHKTGTRQQSHLVALLKSAQTIVLNNG